MATKPKRKTVSKGPPDLWVLIEDAWSATAPELVAARGAPNEETIEDLDEAAEEMLTALRGELDGLDKGALMAVDRQLEKALHKLDREALQGVTDGSDDGFLYARGFIVAMGKRYFDAVDKNAGRAVCDAELEAMCYLPWNLYREKFGDMPPSGISRETGSNKAGW
jgi:hypothetical protein